MNIFLLVMLILLLLVNLFAVMTTNLSISKAYNIGNSFGYCLGSSVVTGVIFIANVALASILDESGCTGLAVLIQIACLIINILLIILFTKINYRRNVKPTLQIKI